jgi:hypothetical protein
MARRPDFFIPGAPKCGTTALADWLAAHPRVYMSPRKEPHYFNHRHMPVTRTRAEYEALFAGAGPEHIAVGEASTYYLYASEAIPAILDYAPQARFVVALRNPFEMAPALHGECLRQGWENVRDFATAWRLQPRRRAGEKLSRVVRADPDRLQYGAQCLLGAQLARLYAQVPRERVLPVLLEDMRGDAGGVYRRVQAFLGLPDDGRSAFPVANAAARTRSLWLSRLIRAGSRLRDGMGIRADWGVAARLRRLNGAPAARPPLAADVAAELRAFFAEDVAQLSALLRRDLSHWLD